MKSKKNFVEEEQKSSGRAGLLGRGFERRQRTVYKLGEAQTFRATDKNSESKRGNFGASEGKNNKKRRKRTLSRRLYNVSRDGSMTLLSQDSD